MLKQCLRTFCFQVLFFVVWRGGGIEIFAVNRVNRSKKVEQERLFSVIRCLFSVNTFEKILENTIISLQGF